MVVVAHPLTEPGELAVPPLVVVTLLIAVVALVTQHRATAVTPSGRSAAAGVTTEGALSPADLLGRTAGVVLLFLAILAGRVGAPSELDNLAPALVIGVAWPALLLASGLLGPLWPRVNPWDTLARLAGARDGSRVSDVRWAVPVAFGWVAYLGVLARPLQPGTVGAALALYTIFTVAGCLALGRRRYLSSVELFTLVFGWLAQRRGLLHWQPPRGAPAVLGVLAGGALFAAARASQVLAWVPASASARLLVLGVACLAVSALLVGCERWSAHHGAAGAVTAASVPAVASLAVVAAMARDRLFVSLQLLPQLLSDPFGRGWDPFGIGERLPVPAPLGTVGLILTQLVVLLAGHVAGGLVARRRAAGRARTGPTVALAALAGLGALLVTSV